MDSVVRVFAPRSRVDFVFRFVALQLLINLFNALMCLWLLPVYYPGWSAVVGTVVATPFVILMFLMLQHLSQLKTSLAELAATDVLTGLSNRRDFLQRLDPGQGAITDGMLLTLDVDHFKRVNDTWGHAVGDACLLALGERLRAVTRESDIVARIGGEEFAVFLPGAARERAASVGARLIDILAVPADGPTTPLTVTVSVGISVVRRGLPLVDSFRRADEALYRAKTAGRARVAFADDAMVVAA
jgi:diguanylate cyclase